jgi:hypothetical protein
MTDLFSDGIVYGIVDNGIMILGAMTGYNIEKLMPGKFQTGLLTVVGAGLGNTVSDFMGGASTLNWELAFSTAIGCLIGLIFIPILNGIYKYKE